ncbi:FG-GAP repeat domain-containing protein [Actibacterium sp. XHP0104]|uniref:FG-GAP repeat domain-containing protein n=1 Tax=Actibacterium sp. XHP0104 TaxID=2984335 RepID=UPI0021E7763D|nr:VCBS repeat-containing protein [Actibacterium sp. XHP0104]MCV2882577.1 VCBS repeat-containing protein [Actibacterium sp. XHP0104]
MRGAGVIAALALLFSGAAQAQITDARYTDPTARYDHAVLGDALEWGALELTTPAGKRRIVLPDTRVFEDLAPRLADLDGDGAPEVITVETDLSLGARLAVYGETGLIAATPFIGRPHRWLAPLGAADLDGDGRIEIAYIDRPHLAKLLRVWRFENGTLTLVAEKPGLTNHRIGQDFISGGIRDCGQGPEIITANADWSRVIATRFQNGTLSSRELKTRSLPDAAACKAD